MGTLRNLNVSHNRFLQLVDTGDFNECSITSNKTLEMIDLSNSNMFLMKDSSRLFRCIKFKNIYLRNNGIANLQNMLALVYHKSLRTLDLSHNHIFFINVRQYIFKTQNYFYTNYKHY